jgi:hypothetical protein
MLWLSQHWFSHLLWCCPFRRPQMRSEHYAFIWLQLSCDSGLGSVICVEIRRSRAWQEQIQCTQISIRSLAYCLFQTPSCQHCLPRRCVWRETTYEPYVSSKHSATVQKSLAPLKACLHSYMYLLSCVNWMDKNTHCVYRTHNQWNWRCPVSSTIFFEDNNGTIGLGNSGHFKGYFNHIDLHSFFLPFDYFSRGLAKFERVDVKVISFC